MHLSWLSPGEHVPRRRCWAAAAPSAADFPFQPASDDFSSDGEPTAAEWNSIEASVKPVRKDLQHECAVAGLWDCLKCSRIRPSCTCLGSAHASMSLIDDAGAAAAPSAVDFPFQPLDDDSDSDGEPTAAEWKYIEACVQPVWMVRQHEFAVARVWDRLVEYIDDELVNVQALRAVCRGCDTEPTADALCHLAFHEKEDIMLDPYSEPRSPIWMRCIALYSPSM